MLQADLVEQQSAKRWTFYTLKVPRDFTGVGPAAVVPISDEDRIIGFVRENGSITNALCRDLLKVEDDRAWYLLKKLTDAGRLMPQGKGRWRKYVLP